MTLMPFLLRQHGIKTVVFGPEVDLSAGNAQFFDPDPACLIQLRPLLKADYGLYGSIRSGNALLVAQPEDPAAPRIVCYVQVPRRLLKNDRAGVMAGIKRVERFDKPVALRLRELAARTRWPRPSGSSWTG